MRRHLQVGDFMISECEHGGLWLSTFGDEGMQITGERLDEFKALVADFFKRHM